MALKQCKECGEMISSDAKACPKCGKKRGLSGCGIVIAVLFGAFVLIVIMRVAMDQSHPPAQPSALKSPGEVAKTLGDAVSEVEKKTKDPVWQKSRAGRLHQKHPDWGPAECEAIAQKKIHVGMSSAQVREAWGRPEHINQTVTASVTHEQWVYPGSQYVYFNDGVMTSLQQTK